MTRTINRLEDIQSGMRTSSDSPVLILTSPCVRNPDPCVQVLILKLIFKILLKLFQIVTSRVMLPQSEVWDTKVIFRDIFSKKIIFLILLKIFIKNDLTFIYWWESIYFIDLSLVGRDHLLVNKVPGSNPGVDPKPKISHVRQFIIGRGCYYCSFIIGVGVRARRVGGSLYVVVMKEHIIVW